MPGDGSDQILSCATDTAWEQWLRREHDRSAGVWLAIARKGSGQSSPSYQQALDVALCWGWIDAQKRALDDTHWLQRFTPRTSSSRWSLVNTRHVGRLTAEGPMQPPGLREVERARADGRWAGAYSPQSSADIPEDLARSLAASPAASAFFAALDGRNRYAVLHRIESAKKPQTRTQRIEKFVAMLQAGEKIYP
jgi:uncharacterized protein YdeI (YjbR/CyaY-like superfamily)